MTEVADPNQQSKQQTTWESSGGCERCDSMEDRLYPEEPGRPHPHCNCTVRLVGEVSGGCVPKSGSIELAHKGNNHTSGSSPGADGTVEIVFQYRIICDDGLVYEGDVATTLTYEELEDAGDDFDEVVYDTVYDMVAGIAASACKPCKPPPVA